MLIISKTARISKFADIEDSRRGTTINIGENVFIDSFVRIRPVGGSGDVVIGANCFINAGCVMFSGNGITLGQHVLVAPNCTFAPTNHAYAIKDVPIRAQGFMPSRGGIVVEDDVWIGANSIILDGAIIRRGSVIGAGSLVRGEIEAYSINVGSPARRIGWRCD